MKHRVTMLEIARRAGVHVTTVSLALRNHPRLPAKTRERLQRLAAQMGYRPDPALSALVAYRTHTRPPKDRPTLAYVTRWVTQWGWKDAPAHREFFEGATRKAEALGYQLEHFWLGAPGMTDRRMSGILDSRGITGVILASHHPKAGTAADFEWERFSAVKIDLSPREPPLHAVTNDQAAIIRLAMRQALAAGYRRIGLVMPRWWDEFVDLAWSAGFLAVQQHLPAREQVPILYYGDRIRPLGTMSTMTAPLPEFSRWYQRHRPDVILGRLPFIALRFEELGVAVPRDVAFVEIFLENPDGSMAGVRENCARVGEVAVETLAGQMQQNVYGVPEVPTVTLVEGTWFDGASLPKAR